jgi:hypothetical protein
MKRLFSVKRAYFKGALARVCELDGVNVDWFSG